MQAWEEKYYEREEGRQEGELNKLVCLVCKKLVKGLSAKEIAEIFEEDEEEIQKIVDVADKYAPDYDTERIAEEMLKIAKHGNEAEN